MKGFSIQKSKILIICKQKDFSFDQNLQIQNMDTIRDTQKGAEDIRKPNHREYMKQYMVQRRQSIKLPSEYTRDKRCGNISKGSEKFSKINIKTNKSEDQKRNKTGIYENLHGKKVIRSCLQRAKKQKQK